MKEKLALVSVLALLLSVPLTVFCYQKLYRPSWQEHRVITITGIGNKGVWTLEKVIGLNYWWKSFEPATIHIRLNDRVIFRFLSADVFHQFYAPELGIGPVDVKPGYVREIRFEAKKAGVFHYYCTSMCGKCHFYMQGWIVITPPGETPASPRPISCDLCLPAFESPSASDAIALGEYLYQAMGCITCHGYQGRGGVKNYNYIKKTVPAHDRTTAKLFLEDEEDRSAFLGLIQMGADPKSVLVPPNISRYPLVASRFNAAEELIRNGKNAARLDLAGPEPPLQMPAWKDKLSREQIRAIMGYFISLFPQDEDATEG